METSLDLEAMALQMPYVARHPNRTEFHGVLTLVDSVSDRALSGARGQAARICLYLFERDQAVGLIRSG